MEKGYIQVYGGEGHGKSAAAIGRAIQMAGTGRDVVIINFLKGSQSEELLKRLSRKSKSFVLRKVRRSSRIFLTSVSRRRFTTSRMDLTLPRKSSRLASAAC